MSARYPGLFKNAVVAASAGTGKTYFLTNSFVARVLGLAAGARPVSAERIVATTFSRAAALELRKRIEEKLVELADKGRAALDPALAERALELGLAERTLIERAQRGLSELPGSLIDTLHGVAAWVLRRHALELDIVPNFNILDEQQASADVEALIEDALAAALEAGVEEKRAALALIDSCRGLENTQAALGWLLERLDDDGLVADELGLGEEGRHARELARELARICASIAADAPSALTEPALALASLLAATAPAHGDLSDALAVLFGVKLSPALKRNSGGALLDAFQGELRGGTKLEKARALAGFLELAPELEQNAAELRSLLARIQTRLLERRRRQGAFGFGDLLRVARDSLRDRPEVAARAAAQIDTLLIDEFQDTSRVQRDLMLLLRERPECAAKRSAGQLPRTSDLQPAGLIIVGDRKQSIYGFRGADVSVFAEVAAELCGERAAAALELRGVAVSESPVADFESLRDNYRSLPAIIEAVNTIAARDFDSRPERAYEVRYATDEALRPPAFRAAGPRGTLTVVSDDGAPVEGVAAIVRGAEGPLRSAFVAASYCLRAAAEGAAYRHLAVLARRRSTLPLVELALDHFRVPYVVSGRALYATREVRDLFALLRVAQNPFDRHGLAAVGRGLLGGLADPTLASLCEPGRGLLPATHWSLDAIAEPEQRQSAKQLRERILDYAGVAPRLSPRDALSLAVERFELESVLSALPRGQVRYGNVLRLLEIASRHGGGLAGFVRWLDEQIRIDADESEAAVFSEEDDAVRLVTIHGSKGLAFGHVVLLDIGVAEQARGGVLGLLRDGAGPPRLVLRQRGQSGSLHQPLARLAHEDAARRAAAERQRLSYVALTRAERELVLVVPTGPARANTLAATLSELQADGTLAAQSGYRELRATELLAFAPTLGETEPELPAAPPRRPAEPTVTALAIGATALADFALCPRRFELIHVLGLDEPALSARAHEPASDDPRSLGSAAHRLLQRWPLERFGEPTNVDDLALELEREGLDTGSADARELAQGIARFLSGDFALRVRRARRALRELELSTVFHVPHVQSSTAMQRPARTRRSADPRQLDLFRTTPDPAPSLSGTRVLLKTTLDLLVEHEDGTLDIVDYKRSTGRSSERYGLQLAAYRSAVAQHFGASEVRTGLVYLLGESGEPAFFDAPPCDVARLGAELASARWHEQFAAIEKPRCERLGCGFIATCHRAALAK